MGPIETVEVLIFYFDLVGVVGRYTSNPAIVKDIAAFQRSVRQIVTGWGDPYSCLITAFDNVFVRLNANDATGTADYSIVEFAADTMKAAEQAGFEVYFGAVTRGTMEIDAFDQHLVSGADHTDIRSQHISLLCDPHIRAAFAEKWSATLQRSQQLPFGGQPCVWVSEEVFDPLQLPGLSATQNPDVQVLGYFDLAQLSAGSKTWPFPQKRFSGIRPR